VAVEFVKALVPAILKLTPVIDKLVPPLTEVLLAFLPLLPVMTDLLVIALDVIGPVVTLAAAILGLLAANVVAPMIRFLGDVIKLLAKPLELVAGWLETFVGWLTGTDWAAVGDAIAGPFRAAWDWISGVFGGVVDWFKELGGKIGNAFARVGEFLAAPFLAAWGVIKDVLNSMIDGINYVIGGLNFLNPLGDPIPFIPGIGRQKQSSQLTGKTGPLTTKGPGRITAMAHGGVIGPTPGGSIVQVAEAGRAEVIAPVDEIYDAIRSGAAMSATMAPAPQRVDLASSDPMWLMFLSEAKEQIRQRFGGDVDLALGTV